MSRQPLTGHIINNTMKDRNKEPAIPNDWETMLTPNQIGTLKRLETFGWHLHFIRRPLFQEKTVMLKHIDTNETMHLTFDGEPVKNHDIIIRD